MVLEYTICKKKPNTEENMLHDKKKIEKQVNSKENCLIRNMDIMNG